MKSDKHRMIDGSRNMITVEIEREYQWSIREVEVQQCSMHKVDTIRDNPKCYKSVDKRYNG